MIHDGMAFERQHRGGFEVVAISGEVDLTVAGRLGRDLVGLLQQGHDTAVDLSRVTFLDSSGLRELLRARREAEDRGRSFVVLAPSAICTRVFSVTGVRDDFDIRDAID